MKKHLISLVIFLYVITNAYSQDEKFSGGIYFSPVISWFKPENKKITAEKGRFSYGFGLTSDIKLTKTFAFNIGLNFINNGGSLKYTDTIPEFEAIDTTYSLKKNSTIKYKLQFIELPVSIKGKTPEIGYTSFFLKFGISPLIQFKALADVTVDSGDNVKKEIRSLTFGYHVGGGILYTLKGNTKLLGEIVFRNGLGDIEKVEMLVGGKKSDYKVILNSLEIRVGIIF
ncbi:MAG: PorT family protein [Bacteroidales bacterium]|nr:PorT family protein [Bacteroidales bacterium]